MSPGVALTPHALPNTPPPAAPAIFVELTQAVLQRLRDHLGHDVDGTTFPDMLAFEQWTDQFVRSTARAMATEFAEIRSQQAKEVCVKCSAWGRPLNATVAPTGSAIRPGVRSRSKTTVITCAVIVQGQARRPARSIGISAPIARHGLCSGKKRPWIWPPTSPARARSTNSLGIILVWPCTAAPPFACCTTTVNRHERLWPTSSRPRFPTLPKKVSDARPPSNSRWNTTVA